MSNRNTNRRKNEIAPSRDGTPDTSRTPLSRRDGYWLTNSLDRIFEDFRSAFNEIVDPFVGFSYPYMSPRIFSALTSLPESISTGLHSVDVVDEGNHYSVKADLPGFNKDNIDVTVGDDVLELKGESSEHTEQKNKRYMHSERSHTSFHRVIQFPEQIVPTKVEGSMKDGILEMQIPKKEPTSAKMTKVALT